MNRKRFGSSELSVTAMGLGLAALGRPGYINLGHAGDLKQDYDVGAMEAHAHKVLDTAWDAGMRYFDAARSYGRAEAFLGSWLKKRGIVPGDVVVGSKWGYTYTADWQIEVPAGTKHEIKEHSLPVLQRQIQKSRALLGDYLDLYQIHSATMDSGVLERAEVLAELAKLRDSGLAIGFTVSGPQQADVIWKALELSFGGRLLFSTVQATWNLLEQSASPALEAAHQAGLGVIVKEALANGRLTPRNDKPEFQEQMKLLLATAEESDTTVDALALASALSQPFADVVLSGAAAVDQLRSNVKALKVDWSDSISAELDELVEPAAVYWKKRSQLAWN